MERLYKVSGCSMEPTLWDGQIVEVMEGYEEGDVVVAEHEGRLIVKRLVGDRLLGDNRGLSADFFVADVRILGRVEVRTKEELEERGGQLDSLHSSPVNSLSLRKVEAVGRVHGGYNIPVDASWASPENIHDSFDYYVYSMSDGTINRVQGAGRIPGNANWVVPENNNYYWYGMSNGITHRISDCYNIPANANWASPENIYDSFDYYVYSMSDGTINRVQGAGRIPGNANWVVPDAGNLYYFYGDQRNRLPKVVLGSVTNITLSEGSVLPIIGSASDADNGDVVTVKYKINSGTVRNIASGVATGTPLSFAKNLTFSNKRLRDGSTEITGDLAENVDHILTVWAEDDKGGKSTEVTRKFRVIHNRPPVISSTNEDLGTIQAPPSKTYTVKELENDAFTVTEKINGKVIRSFAGVAEQENTITIPHDLWIRLQPGVQHTLAIEATDSKGMTAARTYTFVRQENKLEFKLKKPFVTDIAAKRILVTIDAVVPNGAMMKIEACNNAFDASPTWEDITNHVRFNRGFLFTNTEKTAEQWGVDIRFMLERGTANSQVIVNGFGGAFD